MTYKGSVQRLHKIGRVKNVDVYVHWSVLVISGVMLLGAIRRPLLALVALFSYLGVLLIHECGHMAIARRKGCAVYGIELYPLMANWCCEQPWSRIDRAKLAWGGVLAQGAIGIPVAVWAVKFGYTRFEPVNAAIAIWGFYSLIVAAINLIPATGLDGATAWDLFPALMERSRSRKKRQAVPWK